MLPALLPKVFHHGVLRRRTRRGRVTVPRCIAPSGRHLLLRALLWRPVRRFVVSSPGLGLSTDSDSGGSQPDSQFTGTQLAWGAYRGALRAVLAPGAEEAKRSRSVVSTTDLSLKTSGV